MIESWWDAHAFEFVLWGGIVGVLAVIWLIESVHTALKERRQKRKDGIL